MISLVKSPPNHYDILGLTPAAGEGEIMLAFGRKMSMFGAHRASEAALICAAYEVLRNAEKRREYDRSIGLGVQAEASRQWAFAMTQQRWPGAAPATASAAYALEPQPAPQPEPELPAPPQVERVPTIAERLIKLAEPIEYDGMAEVATQPATAPQPEPELLAVDEDAPEMTVREILAFGEAGGHSRDHGRQPMEWLRTAMLAGGLVASVGLVGGLASFALTNDPASAVNSTTASSAPQIAKASPPPPPVAAAAAVETEAAPPPAAAPEKRQASSSSRFARALAAVNRIEGAGEPQPVEAAAAEPAAQPDAAQMVSASMPLPDRVVARTLDKIGYSCGSVASTAAEGASGVFKITCSSGQTYRATPVHGHYRFRRSGS
jgi:hypothetical protein